MDIIKEKGKFWFYMTDQRITLNFQGYGDKKELNINAKNCHDYYFYINSMSRGKTDLSLTLYKRSTPDIFIMNIFIAVQNIYNMCTFPTVVLCMYNLDSPIEPIPVNYPKFVYTVKKCTCESVLYGCKCGAFESEMKSEDPNWKPKGLKDYIY